MFGFSPQTSFQFTVPKRFDGEVCDGTYPSALHTIHVVPLLSDEEVKTSLKIANDFGKLSGRWNQPDFDRHSTYATCDFAVEDCRDLDNYLRSIDFDDRIFGHLSEAYGIPKQYMSYLDFFCAHYQTKSEENPTAMDELEAHRDGSLLSFTLTLTSPAVFRGGGTTFSALADMVEDIGPFRSGGVVRPDRAGDAVLHCGKLLHGANRITSGERTVLVGFVDVLDFIQRPGAITEACRDWGRMDVAKYRLKRQLQKTMNGERRGWMLNNEKWMTGNKAALKRTCPAFQGVQRRGEDLFQLKRRLEAEDILLRRILLRQDEIETSILEGDITFL